LPETAERGPPLTVRLTDGLGRRWEMQVKALTSDHSNKR
jgi:hypothetical protein